MELQMVEIKQEERVRSSLIQYKIFFYIYVRTVEITFIKFLSKIHSALQGQETGSKFGCISRVSDFINRSYSERECGHWRPLCPVPSQSHSDSAQSVKCFLITSHSISN